MIGPKAAAHDLRPKPLEYKQQEDDDHHYFYDQRIAGYDRVLQPMNGPQPFNGGSHGDRRRNDAIGQQRTGPDDSRINQFLPIPPHEGIQGKYASLPLVVGLKRNKDVFKGCL